MMHENDEDDLPVKCSVQVKFLDGRTFTAGELENGDIFLTAARPECTGLELHYQMCLTHESLAAMLLASSVLCNRIDFDFAAAIDDLVEKRKLLYKINENGKF